MESLEVNKGFAAVLVAGIVFMVAGVVGGALVHPHQLKQPAIKIEGAPESTSAASAQAQQDPPIEALLASADPAKGEADTKKLCVSCHTFNEGGKAGVGPNLYGVVGLKHGHMEGYSYSQALTSKQGPWTFDELYQWLKSPRTYAPGTKMSFAGIENPKERADVIAYLNQNSHHPEPLPAPPAQPAAASAQAKPSEKAPTVGNAARPQPAQVNGAAGQGHAGGGQQMSQPSPNQNQTQVQQNDAQQPPQAQQQTPSNAAQAPDTMRQKNPASAP